MKIVAIISARMTSSRLPGKSLMKICGDPALQHMLKRVKNAKLINKIVVATTTNNTDDCIEDLCNKMKVSCFRGSERDVLGRYYLAAKKYNANPIVRLTADCPMIDPALIDETIATFKKGKWEYVTNAHGYYPDGMDTEVLSFATLEKTHLRAKHPFARENVTSYIAGNLPKYGKGKFKTHTIKRNGNFSHIRWTLDTIDDLKIIRKLVSRLPKNYSWMDALSVATQNPKLLGTKVIEKNEKKIRKN
tara:strand:- start:175 stop:915 length:741 start_codon:yes stop_codon:yes gene_type:complete